MYEGQYGADELRLFRRRERGVTPASFSRLIMACSGRRMSEPLIMYRIRVRVMPGVRLLRLVKESRRLIAPGHRQ